MERDLLLEAIKKNELIEYLEGKENYKLDMGHWVNANAPTDWTRIIPKGLYRVYRENPELKLNDILEDALLEMMNREPFDIYVALSVIYFQLIREQRGDAPFNINREIILENLRKTLLENEKKMKNYFEWEGKDNEDGIWSEVVRIDSLCKNKWNLSILY